MSRFLSVSFGYEMSREEAEKYLREMGVSFDDYTDEDDAYREAAECKFNHGLGCEVLVWCR